MGLYADKYDEQAIDFTNAFIKTLNVKVINYEGQQYYAVPKLKWENELYFTLKSYYFINITLKEQGDYYKQIEDLNRKNFYLKNGLSVSIAINAGLSFLTAGCCLITYSIVKNQYQN